MEQEQIIKAHGGQRGLRMGSYQHALLSLLGWVLFTSGPAHGQTAGSSPRPPPPTASASPGSTSSAKASIPTPPTGAAPSTLGSPSSEELAGPRQANPAQPRPAVVVAAQPATPGNPPITIRARFSGKIPQLPPERPGPEPACAKAKALTSQTLVLGKWNALQNVLVHVSRGAPAGAGRDAQLVHQDCLILPRVTAVTTGNLVRISNADPVAHNLHVYSGTRTILNEWLPPDTPTIAKDFSEHVGQALRIQCDLHPSGTAYVHVLTNPYFAVTNDQGTAVLLDLPPGQYTLTAWHERLGARTAEVTTEAGRPVEVVFTFSSPESARPPVRHGD